jgi:hypothetical protein
MIRTLAITVLWGLTASVAAALAAPDPTALSGSIDKAAPKKANERDPALAAKAEILLDRAHVSPREIDGLTATISQRRSRISASQLPARLEGRYCAEKAYHARHSRTT